MAEVKDDTEAEQAPVEAEAPAPVEAPEESESARYIRIRQAAKEEAAVIMAAEAKAALKAKQKRLKGAPVIEGQAEFLKTAAEVEKSINSKKED